MPLFIAKYIATGESIPPDSIPKALSPTPTGYPPKVLIVLV